MTAGFGEGSVTFGPSGAVQTVSDSRSPLFCIFFLFLFLLFLFLLPPLLNPNKGIS